MFLSYKKQVSYIIHRILELSENMEQCSNINFKTRVSIPINGEVPRQNIYTVLLSGTSLNIKCLVRRPNNYYDLLSKLHKELLENPEYIGIGKQDIEESIVVFSRTLKGLKRKREKLEFVFNPFLVEEAVKNIPNWVVTDLMDTVLPKFCEYFKDRQVSLAHKHKGLGSILDNLDKVEHSLLLETISNESLDTGPRCLLLKVPVEEEKTPTEENK